MNTTPPNTDALQSTVEEELKRLVYLAAQSPQNSKYKNQARLIAQGNIASAIAQHNQARLTAILAKLPEKKELTTFQSGYDEGHRWGYNQAIKDCTVAITAAFEAVV